MLFLEWIHKCSAEQQAALLRLWARYEKLSMTELQHRTSAPSGGMKPYIGFLAPDGTFVGIEPDGYTHT